MSAAAINASRIQQQQNRHSQFRRPRSMPPQKQQQQRAKGAGSGGNYSSYLYGATNATRRHLPKPPSPSHSPKPSPSRRGGASTSARENKGDWRPDLSTVISSGIVTETGHSNNEYLVSASHTRRNNTQEGFTVSAAATPRHAIRTPRRGIGSPSNHSRK
mmetsp:Transcript_14120/g.23669  ORF Transcript_14120/g.23669 Transcript_14120/m.23669 type:complete len:160 (-) Transcript_14120:58-537(-)